MAALRIIVADPCPDNRESLALLLQLQGYLLEEADSLSALVARLQLAPVDLVITEIFRTQSHTHSAVHDAAPGAAVAFYTTCTDLAEIHRSADLGCEHFIKATHMERLMKWLVVQRAICLGRESAGPDSRDDASVEGAARPCRPRLRSLLKMLARSPELGCCLRSRRWA